jgi:hypothetical protein
MVLLTYLTAACMGVGQGAAPSKADQDKLLIALSDIDFGVVYVDDGAADGTVTEKGQLIGSGPNLRPDARVKAVVDLRQSAVPLLIEHLDDRRPTRILFNGRPTPLGHVALDILGHVVKPTKQIFIPGCADDGLGACFQPGYYFRPDASQDQMGSVKSNWQKAYRRGAIQFDYPRWWR